MSEIREVKTKQLDERCPICGQGWMRPTGIVLELNPPQFPHSCTACGYQQIYPVRYPYIVTE
jgi:hypothetical protein